MHMPFTEFPFLILVQLKDDFDATSQGNDGLKTEVCVLILFNYCCIAIAHWLINLVQEKQSDFWMFKYSKTNSPYNTI